MLRIFRTNQFYGAIWLLVYFAILSLWIWIAPTETAKPEVSNPLFERVFAFLGAGTRWWFVTGLGCVLVIALFTNYLHNQFDLFEKENYITAAMYVLPACLFSEFLLFNPAMLASLLLVFTIFHVYLVYNEPLADKSIFNGGLFIGTAILFYIPFLPMALWLLISLSTLRSFKPREWLIAIFGLLTPFWIAFSIFFLMDDLQFFWNELLLIPFFAGNFSITLYWIKLIALGAFVLLFALSILNIFGIQAKKVIQVRKYISSLLLLIPLMVGGLLFTNHISIGHFYPLFIPFALVSALVIEHIKRKSVASFIHLTIVVLVIIGQYFNFEILKYIIP